MLEGKKSTKKNSNKQGPRYHTERNTVQTSLNAIISVTGLVAREDVQVGAFALRQGPRVHQVTLQHHDPATKFEVNFTFFEVTSGTLTCQSREACTSCWGR